VDKRDIVNEVAEMLGTDLKFGYIGNCERWGDDRCWMVWFDSFPRGMGQCGTMNRPALHFGPTEKIEALSDSAFREMILARFERLMLRLRTDFIAQGGNEANLYAYLGAFGNIERV
jgi:hypothetical protein